MSSLGPARKGSSVSSAPSSGLSAVLSVWRRYDLGNFVLIGVLTGVLFIVQSIPPHHKLIVDPKDPAINYPVLPSTVPFNMLMGVSIVLPYACILLVYLLQHRQPTAKRELYYVCFGLAYSILFCDLFTEFGKRVAGRPRPNFIALSGYQPDGTFTGSQADVAQAFQSFPSGHTSLSFAGLAYLTFYFLRLCFPTRFSSREAATAWHVNRGWLSVLCLWPCWLAAWVGLTRIRDYWHNQDDVVTGGIIGIACAYTAFQLHVNWWWTSLHGVSAAPVVPLGSSSATGPAAINATRRSRIGKEELDAPLLEEQQV